MKTKIISIVLLLINSIAFGQQEKMGLPKANWYNLDLKADGMFGISMDKAYTELLKGKKARPVIVAVIDDGLDTAHEDLKKVTWINRKEIPGNKIDDDKNGYTDDVNGWNFLGSSQESFVIDNDEIVLDVRKYRLLFGDKDSTEIAKKDLPVYRLYKVKEKELNQKVKDANAEIANVTPFLSDVSVILKKMGKDDPTLDDFKNFKPSNESEARAQNFMLTVLQGNQHAKAYLAYTRQHLEKQQHDMQYNLNINYDSRAKYPNEFLPEKKWFYGNADIYGPVAPAHGTHVAGIIAALRNNGLGINGVADHVQIMPIRAVTEGDLRGIDEAGAIRYAVDNGAKVINMSFGSCIAQDRQFAEDAIKYALSKDVLFIQASGNSHHNEDVDRSDVNKLIKSDPHIAAMFIVVGASGFIDNNELAAPFSNYGKQTIDVFAPGMDIKSTIPGNHYEAHDGTSMATPVVSGLAAVIREYYPKLTARQVKEIIMKSVVKRDSLKDLCISGGVVNAYEALKLAAKY